MSVKMTCLGWHWVPYRYATTVVDGDGRPVAPFPRWLGSMSSGAVADALAIDAEVGRAQRRAATASGPPEPDDPQPFVPDIGLVNWYEPGARMGMHVDKDEPRPAPVVSFSIGDSCVFRFGNRVDRGRPWNDVVLESGDVFVFGGPARRAYHGVPRVLPGTASADCGVRGGRFNVTVRESGFATG